MVLARNIMISASLTIFFVNVGVNLAKSIKSPSECVAIRDYLGEKQVDTLFLHPCDNVEVINVVKNFKNKTSMDCNDFSMYFVKSILVDIVNPLTYICNLSLQTGIFPDDMKIAKVVPLFKSGDRHSFNNYRPISLLPQFSKVLEKIFYKRMVKFVEDKGIFHDNQFGFRSKRNTGQAILSLVEDVTDAIEKNSTTAGVFIDFKKAFDTLEHEYLWEVLRSMNFGEGFIGMIRTLYRRATSTVMNGGVSTGYFPLERAARQGDPISPTLFVLALEPLLAVLREFLPDRFL